MTQIRTYMTLMSNPIRRRAWMAVAVVALAATALLATATSAVPEGEIVVHGPDFSSHLRLTVSGGDIIVTGQVQDNPVGCVITEGHRSTRCPIADAGGMEIVMGPSDDKIQVEDKLPMPLIVHLGAGSDKLLGNGEPDTCYSEGSKRNRCLGFGGDDICITGQQNSDCVGGEGDDYCKHGAGSDGCFGGPGNDVCDMGPGMDGCHGGPGNDELIGGPEPDQLYGDGGNDFCDGGPGVGRSHNCETGPGG
jgi:Ca2+-binding RTX toxin-like protein